MRMKIKQLLLAGVAAGCLPAGVAAAADMAVKMPVKAPPLAPVLSWTGFYLGGNVGGLWSDSSETNVQTGGGVAIAIPADFARYSGVIGGLQAGYNYQVLSSNFVFGIEGDVDWSSAKKSVVLDGFNTHNMNVRMLSTIRGRLGVAFDRWLPFITGGVAFVNLKNELINTGPLAPPLGSVNRGSEATGWTLGGGAEYAFDHHWSAKAEYLYVGLPTKTVTALGAGGGYNYLFTFKDHEQIARVGINYRF